MISANNCSCSCVVNQNMRHEIIESCGQEVIFGVCCCFLPGSPVGTLVEVGVDFVRTENDQWILPLNRIQIYQERTVSPSECICHCVSDRNFREATNDLCGQFISIISCFCGTNTIIFFGTLIEVGHDYLEVRFTLPPGNLNQSKIIPFTDQSIAEVIANLQQKYSIGEQVIIPLQSICAVSPAT